MNTQKLTQKSLEALQAAQAKATEYGNNEVRPEHLVVALIEQDEGLIPNLFEKLNVAPFNVKEDVEREIANFPKVKGSTNQ